MAIDWKYIIVHHTAAEEKDAAQVRRYHLSLGWRDVGYNFLIERDGKVVTGRSLSIAGAHTKANGMNNKGIGVVIIGNLENHKPTDAQYRALISLNSSLCKSHNIPIANVLGHKEVKGAATACPGKNLNMVQVRNDVRSLSNPAILPGDEIYKVVRTIPGYYTSNDAKNRKNKRTNVSARSYHVYNRFNGMINITTKKGVPGSWINPADNVQNTYYTVKKGDTLGQIALRYKTTVNKLVKLNNIKNPDLIYPGQKLYIK
jgi:N-acetylmuramoyl-L-alanine amidase